MDVAEYVRDPDFGHGRKIEAIFNGNCADGDKRDTKTNTHGHTSTALKLELTDFAELREFFCALSARGGSPEGLPHGADFLYPLQEGSLNKRSGGRRDL